jgi:hypothetical protein
MSGAAHAPYLLCSIYTLRKHWSGITEVHAWSESISIVEQIAKDKSLGIQPHWREPHYRGKNDQFIDKIRLAASFSTEDTILYLDADTTVHGPLNLLFDTAETYGFAATQFNDWTTDSSMMRSRIETLRQYPEIDPRLIDQTIGYRWPSVNGGVWCCKPDSLVLPLWLEWSLAASIKRGTYIADEKVLHLMQTKYSLDSEIVPTPICYSFKTIKEQGRYNCSPVHQSPGLKDEDVVIRHYHGDSNVRKEKSPKGWNLWWPIYDECLRGNVGNVQSWRQEAEQSNKWMRNLPREVIS